MYVYHSKDLVSLFLFGNILLHKTDWIQSEGGLGDR